MIRSTFYGFGTALSGLRANQKSLDVTGNNIANMNTTGYTRQRLDLYSVPAATYKERYAAVNHPVGQGVGIIGVGQIRDSFLDIRFRREAANVGRVDSQLSALDEIDNIFDEVQNDKMMAAFSDLKSQLEMFSQRTGEVESDRIVRASAEYITRLFNQYSRQLSTIREEEEYNLDTVDMENINGILKDIAALNKNIKEAEMFGTPALELKDQRNVLLDELSTYMNIEVEYTKDPDVPEVEDLTVRFVSSNTNTTAESRVLVSKDTYATLDAVKDDTSGQWSIKITDMTDATGKTRKVNEPDGLPVEPMQGALLGTLEVLNESGAFDAEINTFRGIGYYEKVLDLLAADFAAAFNEANSITDENGNVTELPLFQANTGAGDAITAANITISDGWLSGDIQLTASKQKIPVDENQDTSGANENIMHMMTMLDEKREFITPNGNKLFEGSFQEFFTDIGNTVSLEVKSLNTVLTSEVSVLSGIEDLRDGVSGVSLDEEGVNLLQYQKAYTAAARLMTTLDEALDVLVNKLGVVGR